MKKRYLCPDHQESTPSAVVYGDRYFCFGCGAQGPSSVLGVTAQEGIVDEYVEDLEDSIRYIRSLPTRPIRGFNLHFNDRGYYLLWPDHSYYKFRSNTVDTPGGKYRGPKGHRKPPFVIPTCPQAPTLALVEGEFNAMSLGLLELPMRIVSPGGAGDFYSKMGERYLPIYAKHPNVLIVCDNDAPGAQAAIETKARLLTLCSNNVTIVLVDKDFNDVLQAEGKDGLRREVERLGMLRGL
jgi:hypothetical protein